MATELPSKPDTAEEALRLWDAGEIVWSVEMGGLGPGYEQAIQITVFEMIREAMKLKALIPQTPEQWKGPEEKIFRGNLEELSNHNEVINGLGLSGAQFYAACNVVGMTLRHGWKGALDMVPDQDRLIMVSNDFPGSKTTFVPYKETSE